MTDNRSHLSPQLLVRAYSQGVFPMARGRSGLIDWYSPDPRAILPLEQFHTSHNLRKRVRRGDYDVTHDRAFEQVIRLCAVPRPDESGTWINDQIIDAYVRLHHAGLAHSVETWRPATTQSADDGPTLVGGLYGVALGGAFFGESMFSRATDASKVCLVHLVEHLRKQGFMLLDVQYTSAHMAQFGVVEVARDRYLQLLDEALRCGASW